MQPDLLNHWRGALGRTVTVEDFAAYVYAVLSAPTFTQRFWDELESQEIRVPLTATRAIFEQAVALGEELLFLHTWGIRLAGSPPRPLPHGRARAAVAIPDTEDDHPREVVYDQTTEQLRIGSGVVEPVAAAVWEYQVSGFEPLRSWISLRLKERPGRRSSPLDDVRPLRWSNETTKDLLQLIWILERTVELAPQLNAALDAVVKAPKFDVSTVPPSSDERRGPPPVVFGQGALFVPAGEQAQLDQEP